MGPSPETVRAFIRERYGAKVSRVGFEEDTYKGLNQWLLVWTNRGKHARFKLPLELVECRDIGAYVAWLVDSIDSLFYERPKRLGGAIPFRPGRKRVRLTVGCT